MQEFQEDEGGECMNLEERGEYAICRGLGGLGRESVVV